MAVFVGLDCGGSSTRLRAVNEQGEVVATGRGGGSNLTAHRTSQIEQSLHDAAVDLSLPVTSVCGGFAGLVDDACRERGETLLRECFPGASVLALPDYGIAHAAATEGTHLTVIAGTGSLVCGRAPSGALIKGGGRGYLLGDAGSGFRYGQAALREFLDRPTRRTEAQTRWVTEVFGAEDEATIVRQTYESPAPNTLLARMFPAFAEDLLANAEYALRTVESELGRLAEICFETLDRLAIETHSAQISLVGGTWSGCPTLVDSFQSVLEGIRPSLGYELKLLEGDPVNGAVRLAMELGIGNGS